MTDTAPNATAPNATGLTATGLTATTRKRAEMLQKQLKKAALTVLKMESIVTNNTSLLRCFEDIESHIVDAQRRLDSLLGE